MSKKSFVLQEWTFSILLVLFSLFLLEISFRDFEELEEENSCYLFITFGFLV